MNPLAYTRPGHPEDAIAEVTENKHASYLAGGTTLVDLLRLNVMNPNVLVDINALPLAAIETLADGRVRIGALVRNSDLADHGVIGQRYPVLREALLAGASPQIRNMATVGGNLLQRTRCPYFRDTFSPCNKRQPGAGCAALEGYNRSHALLGTSEKCIATYPGDMPVALAALDAVIHTRRHQGPARAIPIAEFYVSYGDDPARENVLEQGELITAVELPAAPWLARSTYVKVRDRASYEFALASAAIALHVEAGSIYAARVALGGIATKPWRSMAAERLLVGAPAAAATYQAAAAAALQGARPQQHNAFKLELARRTIARALAAAAAKTDV